MFSATEGANHQVQLFALNMVQYGKVFKRTSIKIDLYMTDLSFYGTPAFAPYRRSSHIQQNLNAVWENSGKIVKSPGKHDKVSFF